MSKVLRKLNRSVIKDPVKARDFNRLNIFFACEQCSYFQPQDGKCNLGFPNEVHKMDAQLKQYYMSGSFAFCRYSELD
ncbi:MAG: hypothetical protein H6625_02485 [Bdellovibrionaceae bacterium]|nr:hypothetical protein [Pseudobdellovibrionaceae bacterium]